MIVPETDCTGCRFRSPLVEVWAARCGCCGCRGEGLQATTVTKAAHATGSSSAWQLFISRPKSEHVSQLWNKNDAPSRVRTRLLSSNEFYTTWSCVVAAGARIPMKGATFGPWVPAKQPWFCPFPSPVICTTQRPSHLNGACILLRRRTRHYTCVLKSSLARQHVGMTIGHGHSCQVPRINFCWGLNHTVPIWHPCTFDVAGVLYDCDMHLKMIAAVN